MDSDRSPLPEGYPGKPLGPQVRSFEETARFSVFHVIRDTFFGEKNKPQETPSR